MVAGMPGSLWVHGSYRRPLLRGHGRSVLQRALVRDRRDECDRSDDELVHARELWRVERFLVALLDDVGWRRWKRRRRRRSFGTGFRRRRR